MKPRLQPCTILVVEDFEPYRRFIRSALEPREGLQIVAETSDGLEAIQKAEELKPDLVLIDIGLPKLNGFEAAQHIRRVAPHSTLLFISQLSSADVIREAFHLGASGYVHKSSAQSDLLPAIEAVLRGDRFISSGLELSEDIKVADITELERADEIRLRYAAIVECSDDAIIAKTLEGVISAWNPAAQRMLGYTQEEAIGRPITTIIPPDLRGEQADISRRLRAGKRIEHVQTRRVSKEGKNIDVSLTISPIKDGGGRIIGVSAIARDITESKRTATAMRESEERFRLVANTAPVMIWMSGIDKQCTYVNNRWLEFTGRSSDVELASTWAEGIHPDAFERCLETYAEAFDRREPFQMEYRLRRKDGEYRWILDRGVPRFSADGSFVGYIGSAIDVTDHKLTESELALANDRLRLAMESGKSVGWDRDVKSGRDILFGDLESVFGMPLETFVGRVEDFHRLVHPEDRERIVKTVDRAMESHEPYAAEFRVLRPDGTVRWLSAKGKFHYSTRCEPERMLGTAVDITERKLAEVALRESEERLRLAVQVGSMFAFEWDVTTDMIIRSEEVTHIPGFAGEPIRFSKQQFLAKVHPEDLATYINSIAELTPENPDSKISFRFLRPDGSVLRLERRGHAFFDEQGKMVRMIGMVADITERMRAEEALSKVSQRLIEAHEEERARLARELHDDINQRLAVLAVNLEGIKQNLPRSAIELNRQIEEVHNTVAELGNDVQTLSHRLHSSKLEILGLTKATTSFCKELSERQGVKTDVHAENVPQDLPRDVSLCLFRVLQEALQNAAKHSGVTHFEVSLMGRPSEIELTVHDSGIGFELEEANRGRGIGLTSMRERLKLVGGHLCIDSKPQHGTTIQALVPITPRTKSAGAVG